MCASPSPAGRGAFEHSALVHETTVRKRVGEGGCGGKLWGRQLSLCSYAFVRMWPMRWCSRPLSRALNHPLDCRRVPNVHPLPDAHQRAHFKRFDYDQVGPGCNQSVSSGGAGSWAPRRHPITVKELDKVYKFAAVVSHHGPDIERGHYTADVEQVRPPAVMSGGHWSLIAPRVAGGGTQRPTRTAHAGACCGQARPCA